MKVKCTQCKVVSNLKDWKEMTFYCEDCNDDHSGVKCPTPGCYSVEGPGSSGFTQEIEQ